MSLFSEFIERNIGKIDDGGFSDYFDEKVYKPFWQDPLEGGRWMQTDPARMLMIPEMYEDFKTNYEGGAFYRDRLGGGEFDKAWGGGNWMKRFGIGGGDDDIDTSSSSGSGSGDTNTADNSMEQDQNNPEEERARLDAIRRMLAGRYGRAETNLTGGAGYGSGSGRSIGGYSG